jgi:hypothetical protein
VIVALAQAALGAVQQGQQRVEFGYTGVPRVDGLFSSSSNRELSGQEVADLEDAAEASSRMRHLSFRRRSAFP